MKLSLIAFFIVFSGAAAQAQNDCSAQAENSLVNVGYTQPAELASIDEQGNQVYTVRSNMQGGDAAYEVIVAADCSYISHRLLWAE